MEELAYKIVKLVGPHDEVVVRSSNFLICKAAFEKTLFVWPNEHLEMRQGARIILKSKEGGMSEGAAARGELIRYLENALAIADEIEDGKTGYLIERALDEARSGRFKPERAPSSPSSG
jgi:hypothetical protein